MRSFYILNQRIKSDSTSPETNSDKGIPTGYRERLRYRDMVWAFHSESQEILLNNATTACNGKMRWTDARSLGVFVWLRTAESLVRDFAEEVVLHRCSGSFTEIAYGSDSTE